MTIKSGPDRYEASNGIGDRWIVECPFISEHVGTSAAILRMPGGGIVFKCHGNRCRDRTWSDVRHLFERQLREPAATCAETTEAEPAWQDSEPWPALDEAALYGPIGGAADAISRHSEGDRVAILTTMLAAFGNAVGNGPHIRIGAQHHTARIFPLHVGETARGRKSQAFADGVSVLGKAAPVWHKEALTSGLGSGEGLLEKLSRIQRSHAQLYVCARAFVFEPEFARLSAVAGREGSTLSAVLRDCFDRDRLELAVRRNAIVVDNAHVTIVAQSTPEELRSCITGADVANGFANRFLFLAVKRSQSLPFGGSLDSGEMQAHVLSLKRAIDAATRTSVVEFAAEARDEWVRFYNRLDSDRHTGLAANLLARGDVHVLRISLIYALADGSEVIRLDHLRAAQAIWAYSEASARYVFGETLGNDVAQRLLDELRAVFPQGLDRTAQHRLFQRHILAADIAAAAKLLVDQALATVRSESTPGRSRRVLYAIPRTARDCE